MTSTRGATAQRYPARPPCPPRRRGPSAPRKVTIVSPMPQKTGRGRGSSSGRATPPKNQRPDSGRYTPPIPRDVRHSPRWYPYVLLSALLLGVLVIILNYINVLPKSPTNWYTLSGLILIL